MVKTAEAAPGRPRSHYWWIGGTIAVVTALIATTALLGGFADRETPVAELDTLTVGEPHENERYRIVVTDAVIADEYPAAGVYPEDDERVLVLLAEVTNLSGEAFAAAFALDDTIELPAEWDEPRLRATRDDDGTRSPWLQPDLPLSLLLAWPVPKDVSGDEFSLTLHDPQRYVLSRIATGTSWSHTIPGAIVIVPLTDLGAGLS